MSTERSDKERPAKEAAAHKPTKEDLHEQRENGQPREGVVHPATPQAPLPQQ